MLDRRDALKTMALGAGLGAVAPGALAGQPELSPPARGAPRSQRILLSVKIGMVGIDAPLVDKFRVVKSLGYDGIELNSPDRYTLDEVLTARDEAGIRIHGVVDSVHWNKRLSSPDANVRAEGRRALEGAIRDSHAYGGSSVLVVPGRVSGDRERQEDVWHRSIEEVRRVLPLAADLGVFILIENVWNGFCYTHDGPSDQSADQLAAYIDAFNSPWVGSYFDLGNHRKYGVVEDWVRTLGSRIVKLDVKDWSFTKGGRRELAGRPRGAARDRLHRMGDRRGRRRWEGAARGGQGEHGARAARVARHSSAGADLAAVVGSLLTGRHHDHVELAARRCQVDPELLTDRLDDRLRRVVRGQHAQIERPIRIGLVNDGHLQERLKRARERLE